MDREKYDTAVKAVKLLKRVGPLDLTFFLNWKTAQTYMVQMEEEGIVGPPDDIGWRDVLPTSGAHSNRAAQNNDKTHEPPKSDKARIAELEEQVARLKNSGRIVIAQREEWKTRALAAEKSAKSSGQGNTSEASDQSRYATLKRVLARELHPDYAPSDGIERIIREAIFKKVWPQVEIIERAGSQANQERP